MKKLMSFIAAATLVLGMAVAPATAVACNADFSVEMSADCDNCGKEGCTGCEAKKGEAKKECKKGEKKACCTKGSKKEAKKAAKAEKQAEKESKK